MPTMVRVVLLVLILVTPLRQARAQVQVAQAVYGDVREVIEELIRSEITKSVVARVREKSPVLGFYFQQTLQRLESSYWGNLNSKLSADMIVLVSDYIYWAAAPSSGGGAGGKGQDMSGFFSCFLPSNAGAPRCAQIKELSSASARSLVDRHCRRLDTAKNPQQELACDLALATRAGLMQQSRMALRHVVDAVSDILLHDLDAGPARRRMRDLAQSWLGDPLHFPSTFPDLFLASQQSANQLDAEAVKAMCKDRTQLSAFFADPRASQAWVCFAISYNGLPNSLAFRVQITLPGNGGVINRYHRYWEVADELRALEENVAGDPRPFEQRLYSMFVNATFMEHCARNMNLKPARGVSPAPEGSAKTDAADAASAVCRDKTIDYGHPVGADVTISWLDLKFNAKATSHGFQPEAVLALARASNSFAKAMQRIDQMRALVPGDLRDAIFVQDAVDLETSLQSLRAFLRVGQLVSELRARWYLWPDDPSLDDATRLRSIDLGGLLALALEEAAPAQEDSQIQRVRHLLAGKRSLALRRVLGLAFRAEMREIAVESVGLALGLEHSSSARPFETFFLSLTGYLLDDSGSDGVTVTRESFRAAAKDLLQTLPSEGVPSAEERVRFRPLPLLSAQVSFNDGFRNESGRAGMRTQVSADWPVAYLALSDFVGLRASAIDLIGPLSELALRSVGPWQDSKLLWMDFLRPRLTLWLAVPQISKRLILDAGVGLRVVGTEAAAMEAGGKYLLDNSLQIHFGLGFVL